MSTSRPINRAGFLLSPSVDDWAARRLVVEVVEELNLSELEKSYRGWGYACCHPAVLLRLLIYGYATPMFAPQST